MPLHAESTYQPRYVEPHLVPDSGRWAGMGLQLPDWLARLSIRSTYDLLCLGDHPLFNGNDQNNRDLDLESPDLILGFV